ncbi:MAG TPA: hypothetical protein VEU07_11805, partial [Candidatus Acidoferrum sp.]|nr:hypothetical protein [Candidatus Acidoferrum sp.]
TFGGRGEMMLQRILGSCLVLLAANQAFAAELRVTLVPELSDEKVWQFEVINDSVDMLDVVRLTATFYADGRRIWSAPVSLTPSLLRRGESGWVTLDARLVPKRSPLRIDWELTWNPHSVPVLPRFWKTERVASVEIRPASPSTGAAQGPDGQSPGPPLKDPTWRF